MSTKKYQRQNHIPTQLTTEMKLPTHLPIAIYYRQSTEAQIGNISTTLQTVDMVKYLQQQGWDSDKIIMLDMDAGISGTTKIDERPGMSRLYGLIIQNKLGAVACQDEDRLFRDFTQIQVNIFIEACRIHKVFVITPTMIYNFSHEQFGTFHARQFRFKSEMAAEYINAVILGKLMPAKRSLLMSGKWAGNAIPVGFMIDLRKKLPDGRDNENYRKLIVFEEFAVVVREYFRIYVSYSGNITKTLRHIHQQGPYFPDPATCLPPEGFRVVYKIRHNAHGWCPKAVSSLIQIFTNAAYIGHWVVNSTVVCWNNHPAIVDEATFYRAFNYLSSVALDGNVNPNYRPNKSNARPSKDTLRPEDRPLFAGLIFSPWEGQLKNVGTSWKAEKVLYYYTFTANDGFSSPIWNKQARYLDAAVSKLLLEKLKSTFDYETWEEAVEEFIQEFEEQRKLKVAQVKQLENVMENFVTNIGALSVPEMVVAVERRYQDAQVELERLNSELDSIASHIADVEKIKALKGSYAQALDKWDEMTSDAKREIVHVFIDKIIATKAEGEIVELEIYWADGSIDRLRLPRVAPCGTIWLPQDTQLLLTLVESGAGKLEIAEVFPDFKWRAIYNKITSLTKGKMPREEINTIGKYESYNEYVKRIGIIGRTSAGSEGNSSID